MKRFGIVMGITAALGLGLAVPAFAQYPTSPTVQCTTHVVVAGQTIGCSGANWDDNSQVAITFQSTPVSVGTANTDNQGSFSTNVTIPSNATPGSGHQLIFTGQDQQGAAAVRTWAITVIASSGGTSSSGNPAPGQTITVTAGGFQPGTTCTITFQGATIGTTTANANGVCSAAVTIPSDAACGPSQIEITGVAASGGTRTVVIPITVTCPGGVAFTGSSISVGALILALLAVAGAGFLVAGRRRNKAHAEQ